jgi:hypothetical protein
MVNIETCDSTLQSSMLPNESKCSDNDGERDREAEKSMEVPASTSDSREVKKRKYSFKSGGGRNHGIVKSRIVDVDNKSETLYHHENTEVGTTDSPIDHTEQDEPDNDYRSASGLLDHNVIAGARDNLSASDSLSKINMRLESEFTKTIDLPIKSILPVNEEATHDATVSLSCTVPVTCDDYATSMVQTNSEEFNMVGSALEINALHAEADALALNYDTSCQQDLSERYDGTNDIRLLRKCLVNGCVGSHDSLAEDDKPAAVEPISLSSTSTKDQVNHRQKEVSDSADDAMASTICGIDTQSITHDDIHMQRKAASPSSNINSKSLSPYDTSKEYFMDEDCQSPSESKRKSTFNSPTMRKRHRFPLLQNQEQFRKNGTVLEAGGNVDVPLLFSKYESREAVKGWVPYSIPERKVTPNDPELNSMICIEHLSRKRHTEKGLPVWEFVVHGGEDGM